MAAAKVAPSSVGVAADAQNLTGDTARDAPAHGERPEQGRQGERDKRADENRADERDQDWPGPIDEPPPLFAS